MHVYSIHIATTLLLGLFMGGCSSQPLQQNYAPKSHIIQTEEEVPEASFNHNLQQLLERLSQSQGIPLEVLQTSFKDTKTIPTIRKLVLPPSSTFKKNWVAYRGRFIEPIRIKAGRTFFLENQNYLNQVAQDTGVPAEIIAAIIGIETIYGRQMGNFRVKDALATLAFNYPDTPNKSTREQLFKNELEALIFLCWTEAGGSLPASNSTQGVNIARLNTCLNQNSSYAGAIGLPQFMPSSIRRFAVDGDGNGQIDLKKSPQDAIASVGNFLRQHGWQTEMPIYFPVQADALAQAEALADGEPELKYTVADLISKGILKPGQGDLQMGGVAPQSKALIVDLPYPDEAGNDRIRYVVGLNNFLAIVQYNRSYFYAQSVAEFAEALGYQNQSVVPTPLITKQTHKSKVKTVTSKKK
jgi:membrane-bound lytic murein transglycosylase B